MPPATFTPPAAADAVGPAPPRGAAADTPPDRPPQGPFDPPAGVGPRAVRGGLAALGGQGVRAVVRLAGIAALGRLLAPADFGLVAMVTVLTGFVGLFTDVGLSAATVQSPTLSRRQVSTLFWLNIALGCVLAGLTAASAPLVAWFYGEPRLALMTVAVACSFLFAGLTVQHQAVLRRRQRFTTVSIVLAAAHTVATAVGIAAAWAGWGPWSLIVMSLSNSAALMAFCWAAGPWLPDRPGGAAGLGGMLKFGAAMTGFSLTEFGARNLDNLLIGWRWGPTPLGLYSRAYGLLMLPVQQTSWPLGSVAVSALARVQHDPAAFRREFLSVYRLTVMLAAPLSGLCAALGGEIVLTALGPDWTGAVPIFRVLALCAAAQPVLDAVRWVYVGRGRGRALMLWGLTMLGGVAVGVAIGLPWGPIGVAAGYAAAVGLLIAPGVRACTRGTSIRPREFVTFVWPEWAAGLLAGAAAWPATLLDAPPPVRFAAGAACGVAAAAALLLATGRLTAAIQFFTERFRPFGTVAPAPRASSRPRG